MTFKNNRNEEFDWIHLQKLRNLIDITYEFHTKFVKHNMDKGTI